jgi:N-acetylneuraminic acid mutarotase
MKTNLTIRTAGVSPADNRNRRSCVRENAADSNHLPIHGGGHKRITASVFLVAAWCLCSLLPAIAAPGSWTQKKDMPAPAGPTASCVVDGILYVIGGGNPFNNPLRTVWAYNAQTDSWTRKADMPAARQFHAAAAVDGIIYVVGGVRNVESPPVLPVGAYNPTTDSWTNRANIPTGRACLAACAVDGIIYAIGGLDVGGQVSTVEAYDPKTDQWTRKSSVPRPLWFLTSSVVNGLVYVFEGTDTFVYDPVTDRWTPKAKHSPWSRALMSGTVYGIVYLFGGMTESMSGSFDFTLAYNPAQDRFTARRKMPRTRLGAGSCGVIDGKVYLAGGASKEPAVNPDYVFYKILDVFDPQGGVTPQILEATLESPNRFRLVWQAEAGLKYAVESSPEVVTNRWTRVLLPTGSTVTATNGLVETSCPVAPGEPKQFYQAVEAN